MSKSEWEWGKKPFLRAAGCGGGTVRKKECVGSVWCHTDLMWWRVSSCPTLATGIFPTTEHHSQDIKWEKWWKGPITLQGGMGINQGVLSKSLVSHGVFPPPSLSFPFQFPFCEGCLLSCRRTISGSISGSASSYSGSSSRSRSLSRSLSRSHSRSSSASVSHSPSGSRKSRYSPDPS